MGGADAVLAKARVDFEKGEYRWVAQAVNYVVFADPGNEAARELQADTLEQLGYQAENGTWRNFYLSAARELRDGVVVMSTPSTASPDAVKAMSVEMFLQLLAVRLNGPKAADRAYVFDLQFTDLGESYLVEVENGVLNFTKDAAAVAPTATIGLTRAAMDAIAMRQASFLDLSADGTITITGDAAAVEDFLGLLDTFEFWFNIVTP
jgi:alkyl sulfatase BDS1-like metallo-beta-lactamase superfamily hydrolase